MHPAYYNYADVPSPPQIFNITVTEVGDYSAISLTWEKNMTNNVINYYQYQLRHSSGDLGGHILSASDTTNTSALITGVPSGNLTLSLTAHNCAGKSSTVTTNISISGPGSY